MQVSYHGFPADPGMRKKWIVAIKRDEGPLFTVSRSTKVCSHHFLETDFVANVASGRRYLHESCIPSQFCFRPKKPPRKSPRKRQVTAPPPKKKSRNEEIQSPNAEVSETGAEDTSQSLVEKQHAGITSLTDSEVQVQAATCPACCALEEQVVLLERQLAESKARELKVAQERERLQQQLKASTAETAVLRVELLKSQKCLNELEASVPFGVSKFKENDDDMVFYTGMPSYSHFLSLLDFLEPGESGQNILRTESTGSSTRSEQLLGRPHKLSVEDQLFLVLVKLRLGLFHQHLGHLFCISVSTVSRIFNVWVDYMYLQLSELELWHSREAVDEAMPAAFKGKYASTRVILDATEIRCDVPTSFVTQSRLYSHYKSTHTFKGLVAITPNGLLSFCSEFFTGNTSDRECVLRSGFLDLPFNHGDAVMADKGFVIEDLLKEKNVKLNIPPFLRSNQFTAEQVEETQEIAAIRIHVERKIKRIKAYHIFDRSIPITLAPLANQMWAICAMLTDYQSPLINDMDNEE